ncbi:heme/copper-type cytochrome/quinol oxidase subunit 4 [Devosia sp. UYZn731]|uniref:DUF1499 domain-containing protein n=1 Tax=Devosia sp. UYZn731 TaxID=3156345 RepID=UPI00339B3320
MRILIRTSKWAILARRFGSLAVPLTVIPVWLHREHLIPSDIFLIAAVLAALVAASAVCIALLALIRLWHTGDQGWGRTFSGLLLGLLCLVPVAYFTMLAVRYPPVTDIATTDRGRMPLVLEPDTTLMPPPKLLSNAQIDAIFPNVRTRTYPLDAQQAYDIVLRMVTDRGWDIRRQQAPASPTDTGRINARIVTLFGWREEAVLLITGTANGVSVDMRSASINAIHDFGSNGQRIEDFLVALDTEVTTLLRDNPNADQPVEADPDDGGANDAAPANQTPIPSQPPPAENPAEVVDRG